MSKHFFTNFVQTGIFAYVNDGPKQILVGFLELLSQILRIWVYLAGDVEQNLSQLPVHEG